MARGHCPSVTSVLGETPEKTQPPPGSNVCARAPALPGSACDADPHREAGVLGCSPRSRAPVPRLLREGAPAVPKTQSTAPAAGPRLPRVRAVPTWGAVSGAGSAALRASAPRGNRQHCSPRPRGHARHRSKAPPRGSGRPLASTRAQEDPRQGSSARGICACPQHRGGWGGVLELVSRGCTSPQGWLGTTAGFCACARRDSRRAHPLVPGHLGGGGAETGRGTPRPVRPQDRERLRTSSS